ncbi:uncharacterized protein RCC_08706 [Ramularia collo-cygni]|uniref:Uncharacterized protein n=1 Tax=Ramularia collo-cygni TaxID=112498 RepID=A0A2D3VMW1_9PEZI|nr:uncharacterized protein RCC_08706 [Ramularia collo-cygni]CZT22998.1 uncharacterized protein RCC_08706 [Ramularia collo-cygni]
MTDPGHEHPGAFLNSTTDRNHAQFPSSPHRSPSRRHEHRGRRKHSCSHYEDKSDHGSASSVSTSHRPSKALTPHHTTVCRCECGCKWSNCGGHSSSEALMLASLGRMVPTATSNQALVKHGSQDMAGLGDPILRILREEQLTIYRPPGADRLSADNYSNKVNFGSLHHEAHAPAKVGLRMKALDFGLKQAGLQRIRK